MERIIIRHLIKFELVKNFKRPRTLITFGVLTLFIFIFLCLNFQFNYKMENNIIDELEYSINSIDQALNQLPEEKNSKVEQIREDYEFEKNTKEEMLEEFKRGDWKSYISLQNSLDEHTLNLVTSNKVIGGEPPDIIEERLALNKELLVRGIEPVEIKYSPKGLYFIMNLFQIFLGFVGLLFFILINGDSLSNEYEKGTIKFLYTQPLSKLKILNVKVFVSILTVFVYLLYIFVIGFSTSSLLFGTGNWNYPILSKLGMNIGFLSFGRYFFLTVLLFLCLIVFVTVLQFLFSVLTSNNILSIGFTIIITSVFYLAIFTYGYFKNVASYIPFSYFDISGVIKGSSAFDLDNNQLIIENGVITILIWTVFLYILTVVFLKKKNNI